MNTNVNKEIGKRIIEIRSNMNMKQSEFAKFCGISRQTLCNIELGKNSLTIKILIDICNLTGTSADYIVLNKADFLLNNIWHFYLPLISYVKIWYSGAFYVKKT